MRKVARMAESADDLLAAARAASLIGVHRDTLKRYEDRDQLITSIRTPKGHRRYRRGDVLALIHRYNAELDGEAS
jgi:DNA-binding transcriptional MerR regulator